MHIYWCVQILVCVQSLRVFTIHYRQISDTSRTVVGNKIVGHSNVVGASPIGAAPTVSSCSTWHQASIDCAKTTARRDEKTLKLWILARLLSDIWRYIIVLMSQSMCTLYKSYRTRVSSQYCSVVLCNYHLFSFFILQRHCAYHICQHKHQGLWWCRRSIQMHLKGG